VCRYGVRGLEKFEILWSRVHPIVEESRVEWDRAK
jgi:hypothetical protein